MIMKLSLIRPVLLFIVAALLLKTAAIPVTYCFAAPKYYIMNITDHQTDEQGNCIIHVIIRNSQFPNQVSKTASSITAWHRVMNNEHYRYRTYIYLYHDVFEYQRREPYKILSQDIHSEFTHI
ncbi:MAG: hypothetical protein E7B11_11050 [Clostridiales bacterium]|nr:hypothetical protein [Clostridiales bacterium]MDU3241092.1 hypothetical protein [Clostridiales bacterium]